MIRLPHHNHYAYSPIVERKDYSWPEGKRLAVYLGLNIKHFAFGAGEGHLLTVANPQPDLRAFAWRDYGNRVGVWRCLELFDELNPAGRASHQYHDLRLRTADRRRAEGPR
jgi:allantoinase